jgi:hypothetical protein
MRPPTLPRRSAAIASAIAVAIASASGCSSPRSNFYTLSADPTLERSGNAVPAAVVVGPVTIPDLVDRPQLVTRLSNNAVALNEFARWGEPLKSGIAFVIASDLARLLGSDRVSVSSQSVAGMESCRVRVDIVQFDSIPGDAVVIDALWTVRVNGRTAPIAGRSLVREPVQGADDAALVAAHSRALASVSRDIAAAIRGTPG